MDKICIFNNWKRATFAFAEKLSLDEFFNDDEKKKTFFFRIFTADSSFHKYLVSCNLRRRLYDALFCTVENCMDKVLENCLFFRNFWKADAILSITLDRARELDAVYNARMNSPQAVSSPRTLYFSVQMHMQLYILGENRKLHARGWLWLYAWIYYVTVNFPFLTLIFIALSNIVESRRSWNFFFS